MSEWFNDSPVCNPCHQGAFCTLWVESRRHFEITKWCGMRLGLTIGASTAAHDGPYVQAQVCDRFVELDSQTSRPEFGAGIWGVGSQKSDSKTIFGLLK